MRLVNRVIRRLALEDGPGLERLRRAYAAEILDSEDEQVHGGFAPALLAQRDVLCWGGFVNGELVGFAVVAELLEVMSGRCYGLLDGVYVAPHARHHGLAYILLNTIIRHGEAEDWTHLRCLVPEADAETAALCELLADEAPWRSFMIYY
ncbi:MAG: GNAT family N-acetyltransferase [Aestuariivirga sp.]|uniref:GNAT family N-acetyltransferase n=1 Tax=Aestuariivirga sp. TaxID=2650926 RepID=UPI0025C2738E|nr:GNAT family N-acetyltransferase [Aestuariivirga sp.]MCA3560547.1 GNAT family N-acetyltransferase [Aestuariivirga sp.]